MDANGSTQKKKVTMAEFFDYPEYAYNEKGQLKNWVAGPNPWIPAATVGLLSLLGGIEEAEGGGYGLNLDSIVDAGLLGTKTYLEGTQNLQNQRKDYYDHNLRSQQQLRENLKFQHETEDREKSEQARQRMIKNFPNVLKSIYDSGYPEFQATVPMLQNMFAVDPNKASTAAMNIISQIKTKPGEVKTIPILDGKGNPTGHSYLTQNGQYKTTIKTGPDSTGDLKLDSKTLDGILFKATQPGSQVTPKNYRKYYKMRQQHETVKGVVKDGDKEKMGMFAGPLEGMPTPWEYGKSRNISEEQMTKWGWKKDPTIEQWMSQGEKLPGSETVKSGYKFGQIIQSEDDIAALAKQYPDFDHTKTEKPSADDWLQYMIRGLPANPFTGAARSAEQIYMGGAQGFAYLFSGATVRAEELTQFRVIMYPVPGDSAFDVERKARRRKRIMDLYNSAAPESLKQAFNEVKEAAVEESGEDLKLELNRNKKVTKKEEVQENLIWD